MSYRSILEAHLRDEEDDKPLPYQDSLGVWTVGVGHNMGKPMPEDVRDLLLDYDMHDAEVDARALFSSFDTLSDNRKAAVCDLAFNMGRARLSQFHHFIAAVGREDWAAAVNELKGSLWWTQVGTRGPKIAALLEGDSQ